ncbi:MAG TPA: hypothetical protein VMB72_06575 [Acidimicrobiales bacterium]|nr:hypothetical protein [Acidimicrobiales bacterium]
MLPTRGPALWALAVAVAAGTLLAGCGVVKDASRVVHNVENDRTTIDSFTSRIQSGESTAFEATYVTTGASPTTIEYAVSPPTGLLFKETSAGGGTSADVIVNSSGEYTCTPPSGPGAWSCDKLGAADAAVENKIFDIYTPSHWTSFLKGLSIAAGLAGDKVSSSTMTVNGFAMQCVDLVASGIAGTSSICTTAQNILGYVEVASDATSFEITSYSASPAPSLFQLPPGAHVTTVTVPSTTVP